MYMFEYLGRFFNFYETHPTVAGYGQSLMVAVAGNLYPSLCTGLQHINIIQGWIQEFFKAG